MMSGSRFSSLLALPLLIASTVTVYAQPYPAKSIRLIQPFAAGGGADILARIFSQKLYESMGRVVIVDTRTGAGGNVGAELTAKSPPDGYTLMLTTNSLAVNVTLYPKLNYSALND